MGKKYFAAGLLTTAGFALFLGGSNVSAAIIANEYTPGDELDLGSYNSSYNICIEKDGGYTGDAIVANIRGTNYEKQLVYSNFSEDRSCVLVANIPSNGKLKFSIPMGMNGLSYMQATGVEYGTVTLNLDETTSVSKYLKLSGLMGQRVSATRMAISFNANGGEGAMAGDSNILPGSSYTLPQNEFTRSNYRFMGWNTKADGTGVHYDDIETITVAGNATGELALYAEWIEDRAVLDDGITANLKMKKMAGTDASSKWDKDWHIKAVRRADALPNGFDKTDGDHIISDISSVSPLPIFAWFDDTNDEGVLNIYSEAGKIEGGSDMRSFFAEMKSLTDLSFVASLDVSHTENMSSMFEGLGAMTEIVIPDSFDTSSATDMSRMFRDNPSVVSITLPSSFTTSNVTDMGMMFGTNHNNEPNALSVINGVEYFDTSNVHSMSYMFGDDSFTNIEALRTTQRDGYVSWDVSNVSNLNGMFNGNALLSDISPLSSWDVSGARSFTYTFGKAPLLSDISAIAEWDVSNAINFACMFRKSTSIRNLQPLSRWNMSAAESIQGMFEGTAIESVDPLETTQRDGYISWDMSNVTDMTGAFAFAASLTDISALASWNVSNVARFGNHTGGLSIAGMFQGTAALMDISPISGWDVSNAVDMNQMFAETSFLDATALSAWNTSSLEYLNGFLNRSVMTNLDFLATTQRDGYVSWDVSNVVSLYETFGNMESLRDISALATWDVANVTDFDLSFRNDRSIDDLSYIENWTINPSATMVQAFDSIPSTVARPSWYHE